MRLENFLVFALVFSLSLIILGSGTVNQITPFVVASLNGNLPPNTVTPSINTSQGTNTPSDPVNCYAIVTDPNGDSLNVSFRWYNNNLLRYTSSFYHLYPNGSLVKDSYYSALSGDAIRCVIRVSDNQLSTDWISSSSLLIQGTNPTCSDGTVYSSCSVTKPKYCMSGALWDFCAICGCPSGLSCNASSNACYNTSGQPPIKTCSDGTVYSTCSATKPKYCDNGNLVNQCSACGCPLNQLCNATTNACYTPPANQTPPTNQTLPVNQTIPTNQTPVLPKTCSDGTLYGQCSSSKPNYCDNGKLVNRCNVCDCPSQQLCNSSSNVCYTPRKIPTNVILTASEQTESLIEGAPSLEENNYSEDFLIEGQYIVEFKEEPMVAKYAELNYETNEMREQAQKLREEAKKLLGQQRVTRNTQAVYIENVAAENEKSVTNRLREQQNALQSEQDRALVDLKGRTQNIMVIQRYKNALNAVLINVSKGDIDRVKQSPFVKRIQQNVRVQALLTESVPRTGAPEVWAMTDPSGQTVTGKGVKVAVIDTGIDYTHPDLGGCFGPSCRVVGGYDFFNKDNDPMDDNGHGTHCAGIIGANGVLKGMAPDVKFYAYKVLGADGSGYMSDVAAAIDRAVDPNGDGNYNDHVDVISMSLGSSSQGCGSDCIATKNAIAAGVTVAVAAGNSGPKMGSVGSPGITPEAITVGAADKTGKLASFSSRGPISNTERLLIKPEISAPGVYIYSTVPRGSCKYCSSTGYGTLSGTSMATPHVAGAAALLKQLHPDWTPAQVKSALITGAKPMSEPIWHSGAGELHVPSAAQTNLFIAEPLISFGRSTNAPISNITLSTSGPDTSFAVSSQDWLSLYADGWAGAPANLSMNRSQVTPSFVTVSQSANPRLTLSIKQLSPSDPEGYFDGYIALKDGSHDIRVPFGYVDLSKVTIHALDLYGREVVDPYGGTWIYNVPDGNFAAGVVSDGIEPSPPATFFLPSGNYSVHALGHQLIYAYSDPYILSGAFSMNKNENRDVYLRMTEARPLTINLTTEEGQAIVANEYRIYWRYEGRVYNLSSHRVDGSASKPDGTSIFSLPKTKTMYISDTNATIGLSISGYSYTPAMWDFMSRNWNHWYEQNDNSNFFSVEASSDLQYLLSWEFLGGVNSSLPAIVGLNKSIASVYKTKYEIPGTIINPWVNWGTAREAGGESNFWVRRDTQAMIEPFFSGLTRTIYVQGPFSDFYFPRGLFSGFIEKAYFTPDYSQMLRAAAVSEIYLPNRNFIQPIVGKTVNQRLGAGPFYASVFTENTNSSLVLFHPLYKDQGDAAVIGNIPQMKLYYNGQEAGIYSIGEHVAYLTAKRIVSLFGSGSYCAVINAPVSPQIFDSSYIKICFSVPKNDVNPPRITSFRMLQRFVGGEQLDVNLTAVDDQSQVSTEISWRPGGTTTWNVLTVSKSGDMFSAKIPTTLAASSIDLDVKVSDASGNYLEFNGTNAALKQIPVLFDISPNTTEVEYINGDFAILLSGYLKDVNGAPLHPIAAVPLELWAGDKKVATILDEYIQSGSHVHNGTIAFEWHFNPTLFFTGVDQTIQVKVPFDLGIYEPTTKIFSLHSLSSTQPRCSDGTLYDQCSSTKPKYCSNGQLVDRCSACGCPTGYSCDPATNSCYPICSDGTPSGQCSATRPMYCDNGNLIKNCQTCGCISSDYACNQTSGNCDAKMCSDGTPYGQCSSNKPYICDNGALREVCAVCGCSSGKACTGLSCVSEPINNPPATPQPFLVSALGKNTTQEDLTCSAQVNDPDGDSMNSTTYWYNNSSLYAINQYNGLSNGNFSTAVLKSGNLSAGQKWQCRMIASDGKANSSWGESNNITIRNPPGVNSPPNDPRPSLVSYDGSNTVSSDLLCYDTIADIDDDRMNATVQWFKNGLFNLTSAYNNNYPSFYNFNVSLAKTNLTLGDIWQCSIRLYDGKANSGIGYSSNLTIVAPPAPPQPPSGGGGGGGGGWTPPSGGGTTVTPPPQKEPCVSKLDVTLPEEIFVPQGVTKEISIIVKNTGTCPLSSLSAVLSLPTGWQANSYMLDSGLDVNETGIMSIRLMPLYSPIGDYPVTVRLDAPNVSASKSAKVYLLENPPYVVSQEGPSASRIFEYIIALILIEFVFGSIVMIVWFKPPQEKLPPLPQIGYDLKPVKADEWWKKQ